MSAKSKFKRKPAKLLRIRDLKNLQVFEFDEQKFFKYKGQSIHKIAIFGTVVQKYIGTSQNNKKYAVLTIDDGTGTIKVKQWVETEMLEKAELGEMVDIIGKPREFQNEIYLAPEIIQHKQTIADELLRRAELIEQEIEEYGLIPQ